MEKFSFPYPPYPVQLDLMQRLDECLEGQRIGIFESPTGTGKTLSVLCATLSWLERQREEETKRIREEAERKITEDSGDWLAGYANRRKQEEKRDEARDKLEIIDKIKLRLSQAERSYETREESRLKRLAKADRRVNANEDDECVVDDEEEGASTTRREEEQEEPLKCTKIFYASRTHSQLQQVLDELAKTRFRPRVVTLGSRSMLCTNTEVLALKANHLINERCMELRKGKKAGGEKREPGKKCARSGTSSCTCEYYKADAIEELTDGILSTRLVTPHQVLEDGRCSMACPYFASRRAVPLAELVLLPYQVLLHESARQSWGIDLKENVVVLDEAHNVIQTIAALHSCEVSLPILSSALSLLRQYVDTYRLRLSPLNLASLRQLVAFVAALEAFLRTTKSSESLSIQTLLIKLSLHSVNLFDLSAFVTRADLCRKMHGFYVRQLHTPTVLRQKQEKVSGVAQLLKKKSKTEDAKPDEAGTGSSADASFSSPQQPAAARSGSPLFPVKSFLDALTNPTEDGRVLVDSEAKKLKFVLLNPGARLCSLVAEARCILLVGGTMEPAELLVSALSHTASVSRPGRTIERFCCAHVVPEENVLAMCVGSGVDESRLDLRMENRGRPEVLSSLGRSLQSICQCAPNGVVVFFPSYAFLEQFVRSADSNGIMRQIRTCKEVFTESKGALDTSAFLERYSQAARTARGALLLAVVGGRLSEGINFNDELGRAVIVVGLPYANKSSVELQERMRYLDSCRLGQGAVLYESLCWHAVNQAVGRALRHRADWASIILLDSRFAAVGKGKISGWLESRLSCPSSFKDALTQLRDFYSRHSTK